MLAALLTLLLLGGGSAGLASAIADTQKDIKQVVVDESRRDDALTVVKNLKARSKSYEKFLKSGSKQMRAALSGAGVTEADVDATWEQLYQARQDFERDLIDARFELRELVTRDEWQQLFARPVSD
jgi:hypothetical protein